MAAFAELERELIRERVVAGLKTARANGTKTGRSIGRPHVVFDRAKVAQLLGSGLSQRQIARQLSIGPTTVRRSADAVMRLKHQVLAQPGVETPRTPKGAEPPTKPENEADS
jgi:DNA invertase Pin-like site-specific DNA recombinase